MKIRVTLKRSVIGKSCKQRKIVESLGLKRPHQSVVHDDVPSIRGMVNKISHMVEVVKVKG